MRNRYHQEAARIQQIERRYMVRAIVTAAVITAVVTVFNCAPADAVAVSEYASTVPQYVRPLDMSAHVEAWPRLPEEPVTSPIAGSSWRFVEIMGTPTPEAVQPTLQLSVDGAAAGDTGCNQFTGRYVSAGADLSFSDLGYTKMMCRPEVMAVERAVQSALMRTSRMATSPGELDLIASDGTVLARLTAVT